MTRSCGSETNTTRGLLEVLWPGVSGVFGLVFGIDPSADLEKTLDVLLSISDGAIDQDQRPRRTAASPRPDTYVRVSGDVGGRPRERPTDCSVNKGATANRDEDDILFAQPHHHHRR